jgi:hypothetical protein
VNVVCAILLCIVLGYLGNTLGIEVSCGYGLEEHDEGKADWEAEALDGLVDIALTKSRVEGSSKVTLDGHGSVELIATTMALSIASLYVVYHIYYLIKRRDGGKK